MIALTLRLVASLAIVVGLLMLVVWAGRKRFGGSNGRAIDVIHRQQLGRNSTVSVVNVGPRTLVLGTTEQQVTMLTELDDDEAQAMLSDAEAGATPAAPTQDETDRELSTSSIPASSSSSSPEPGTFPSHEEFAVYSNEPPAAPHPNALPLDPELRARLIAALLETPASAQSAQAAQPQPVQPQPVVPQAVYAPVQPVLQPLPQALPPGYAAPAPPISAPVAQLLGQVVQSYLMGGYAAAPQYPAQYPAQYPTYAQPMLALPAPAYAPQSYPAQSYQAQSYPAQSYPAQPYQAPQPDPAAAQASLDEVLTQVMQVVEQRLAEAQPTPTPTPATQAQAPRRASGAGATMGYLGASERRAAARREHDHEHDHNDFAESTVAPDHSPAPAPSPEPVQPTWSAPAQPTWSAPAQPVPVADRPYVETSEHLAAAPAPTEQPAMNPSAAEEPAPASPASTLAAELDDLDAATDTGFEPWQPPSAGSHAARAIANPGQSAQPAATTQEAAEGLSAEQLRDVIAALRAKAGTMASAPVEPSVTGRRVATDRAVDSVSEAPVHAPKRAATLRAVPSVPSHAQAPDHAEPASNDFAAALEEALDSTDRVDLTLTAQGRASTVQDTPPSSPSSQGPLDGSVLSPATWKQAFNAVRVR